MKSFYEYYQSSILNESNLSFIEELTSKCKHKEVHSSLKNLSDKMYKYIKTDGYKEIECLKDGFIFWQE